MTWESDTWPPERLVWTDADERALEEHAPRALCDACQKRPGAVAVDGDFLCEICDSALEIAGRDDA